MGDVSGLIGTGSGSAVIGLVGNSTRRAHPCSREIRDINVQPTPNSRPRADFVIVDVSHRSRKAGQLIDF